jgi:hypothetical protein
MSELETEWSQLLAEAERRAREHGRGDIVEYLNLRTLNDEARRIGIEWLLNAFASLAGEVNRAGAAIRVERTESHRFRVGASTMVGTLLTLRAGLRAMMIEAGWPRAPQDGIVRGGGLASARINHFGNRTAGAELLLMRGTERSAPPQWFIIDDEDVKTRRRPLFERDARRHLARLLDVVK